MATPSTENYVLGRGMLYWDPWDTSTTAYLGERALGNAPEVSINMNATFLDHFSSMSGFKSKDKTVVNEVSPQVTFTLEELVSDNWQLLVFGTKTTVTQTVSDGALTKVIAKPLKGRYFDLDSRSIQTKLITHGTVTGGPFQKGETITGGTSNKTAVVLEVRSSTSLLIGTDGGITTAETITGGTSNATATTTSGGVYTAGAVTVFLTGTPATVYTPTTDYTVDAATGRIFITATSNIAEDISITVVFGRAALTYTKILALDSVGQEGKLRYVSDNPEGGQWEMIIWKVRLKPNGDTALIGDDWAKLGFQGDILRDATYHPTSPYMDLIVTDA